jgi:hypothetical protein
MSDMKRQTSASGGVLSEPDEQLLGLIASC